MATCQLEPKEWIYAVITDRWMIPSHSTCSLADWNDASSISRCGGSWTSLETSIRQGYFTQVLPKPLLWISPPHPFPNVPGDYHGYWASQLYEWNSAWGNFTSLLLTLREWNLDWIYDAVYQHAGWNSTSFLNHSTGWTLPPPWKFNMLPDIDFSRADVLAAVIAHGQWLARETVPIRAPKMIRWDAWQFIDTPKLMRDYMSVWPVSKQPRMFAEFRGSKDTEDMPHTNTDGTLFFALLSAFHSKSGKRYIDWTDLAHSWIAIRDNILCHRELAYISNLDMGRWYSMQKSEWLPWQIETVYTTLFLWPQTPMFMMGDEWAYRLEPSPVYEWTRGNLHMDLFRTPIFQSWNVDDSLSYHAAIRQLYQHRIHCYVNTGRSASDWQIAQNAEATHLIAWLAPNCWLLFVSNPQHSLPRFPAVLDPNIAAASDSSSPLEAIQWIWTSTPTLGLTAPLTLVWDVNAQAFLDPPIVSGVWLFTEVRRTRGQTATIHVEEAWTPFHVFITGCAAALLLALFATLVQHRISSVTATASWRIRTVELAQWLSVVLFQWLADRGWNDVIAHLPELSHQGAWETAQIRLAILQCILAIACMFVGGWSVALRGTVRVSHVISSIVVLVQVFSTRNDPRVSFWIFGACRMLVLPLMRHVIWWQGAWTCIEISIWTSVCWVTHMLLDVTVARYGVAHVLTPVIITYATAEIVFLSQYSIMRIRPVVFRVRDILHMMHLYRWMASLLVFHALVSSWTSIWGPAVFFASLAAHPSVRPNVALWSVRVSLSMCGIMACIVAGKRLRLGLWLWWLMFAVFLFPAPLIVYGSSSSSAAMIPSWCTDSFYMVWNLIGSSIPWAGFLNREWWFLSLLLQSVTTQTMHVILSLLRTTCSAQACHMGIMTLMTGSWMGTLVGWWWHTRQWKDQWSLTLPLHKWSHRIIEPTPTQLWTLCPSRPQPLDATTHCVDTPSPATAISSTAATAAVIHVSLEWCMYSEDNNNSNNKTPLPKCVFGGMGKIIESFSFAHARPQTFLVPYFHNLDPRFLTNVFLEWEDDASKVYRVQNGTHTWLFVVHPELFHKTAPMIYEKEYNLASLQFLSVWSRVVGRVLRYLHTQHQLPPIVQFHDHHALPALFSENWRAILQTRRSESAVVITVHNAHIQGAYALPHDLIARMFDLPNATIDLLAYGGTFNMFWAGILYTRMEQDGHGLVSVSPPYALDIESRLHPFTFAHVHGIWNGIVPSTVVAATTTTTTTTTIQAVDVEQNEWLHTSQYDRRASLFVSTSTRQLKKRKHVPHAKNNGHGNQPPSQQVGFDWQHEKLRARKSLCEMYGWPMTAATGERTIWICFMGRRTEQKGVQYMARALSMLLEQDVDRVRILLGGPSGDEIGEACEREWKLLEQQYPGHVHFHNGTIQGTTRQAWLQATDLLLMPSVYEPCGLTDIEFAQAGGALCIGNMTGGIGKTPGFYFQVPTMDEDTFLEAFGQVLCHVVREIPMIELRKLQTVARQCQLPVEAMLDEYAEFYDKLLRRVQQLHGSNAG